MKTKEQFQTLILQTLKEEAIHIHSLLHKIPITSQQEKQEFLNALRELELDGKIYEATNHHYQLFPSNYQIDKVISLNHNLWLEKTKLPLQNGIKTKEVLLPNDTVVIEEKNEENQECHFFVKRIIKREISSFLPYLLKQLDSSSFHYRQLKRLAHVQTEKEKQELLNALNELEQTGKIYRQGNHYLSFPKQYSLVHLKATASGKVFYQKEGKTYFVKEEELHGALPNDLVIVSKEGKKIIKVVKREQANMVLEVEEIEGVKHLKPILVPGGHCLEVRISSIDMKKLVPGDRILVHIGTECYDDQIFEGDFVQKLGRMDDPNIDLLSIAASKGFPISFSQEALEEANHLPDTVLEKDLQGRIDLRNETIFTIDCPTTKDMDDAISIKKLENGNYLLGVHIAHVSHYIKPYMKLYEEAYQRGTSVYMLNTVLPMLPHLLSNGICSLNPQVDRLCKTCQMEIDSQGKIIDYTIFDSCIHSKIKMDYDSVNQFLEDKNSKEEYLPYLNELQLMKELSDILTINRFKNGYLDFASNDIEAVLDEMNHPIAFRVNQQKDAGRMIENFMICANSCVDSYLKWLPTPSVNRIHEEISHEQVQKTIEKLKKLNYKIKQTQKNDDKQILQSILAEYATSKDYPIVSKIILTSLARAEYSTDENVGHFGLGLKDYTHFTSPIRRFPDLQVETLLDYYTAKKEKPEMISRENLQIVCEHCSLMERQADLAEQESLYLKMMEYIENHKEQFYHAVVTEIGRKRAFVITKNHIPGYLDYQNFSQNVHFCSSKEYLKDDEDRITLKVGDEIIVQAISADRQEMKANFSLQKNLTRPKEKKNTIPVLQKKISLS